MGTRERKEAVLLGIACFVMAVWGITVLVQVIDPDRQVPATVNVVAPIVAAGLFGTAYWTGKKTNGGGPK